MVLLQVANPRNFAIGQLPPHHPHLAFSMKTQALVPPVSEKQRAAVVCFSGSCHSTGLTPLYRGRMLGLRKSLWETHATRWFLGDARWRIPPKSGVCTYHLGGGDCVGRGEWISACICALCSWGETTQLLRGLGDSEGRISFSYLPSIIFFVIFKNQGLLPEH